MKHKADKQVRLSQYTRQRIKSKREYGKETYEEIINRVFDEFEIFTEKLTSLRKKIDNKEIIFKKNENPPTDELSVEKLGLAP